MCYTRGYARAWSSESQEVTINADEHSLFPQSLISAKEEGGTALPPALLAEKFVLKQICVPPPQER